MRRSSRLAPRCRPSFTLIELIVVLAILLALAALAVAMAPRMAERQKTSRAADQLQGWISLSRQWARSARVPTGIRLLPGRLLPNPAFPNVGYVTDLEYIQQPPDFVVSPGLTPTDPVNVRRIQVTASAPGNFNTVVLEPAPSAIINPRPGDFSGGYPDTQRALWPVQPGDYFQANGGGLMHRIVSVTAAGLILETSLPQAISTFTKQYRIVRSPRALPGEATLQLGQDVAIDLTKSQQVPARNGDGSIDIVFAPSGAAIVPGAHDKIILWVRDVTKDANAPGDQTLIAVYVRTGLVGAFEIAPPPADPFLFTRDGRSSGL